MPDPVEVLRCQLTDAALQRSWKAVNGIITDLEEEGLLWDLLHGNCSPANRRGSLSEWLHGCADWQEPVTEGASP